MISLFMPNKQIYEHLNRCIFYSWYWYLFILNLKKEEDISSVLMYYLGNIAL